MAIWIGNANYAAIQISVSIERLGVQKNMSPEERFVKAVNNTSLTQVIIIKGFIVIGSNVIKRDGEKINELIKKKV